jgi:hypothetical protein
VFAFLAEELCAAGQWKEAADVCKKGLLFHPDHMRSRVLYAQALKELGETDRSKRILTGLAQDIRRNSVIFKLLAHMAALSGNEEEAREYAGLYEALRSPKTSGARTDSPGEDVQVQPVAPPPGKQANEWDGFKAEAIEQLQVWDEHAHGEISAPVVEEKAAEPPALDLETALELLAQRFEARLGHEPPPAPLLSEEDKYLLKQRIVAALS